MSDQQEIQPEVVNHSGSIACFHCDQSSNPMIIYDRYPFPFNEGSYICLPCVQRLARDADDQDAENTP